MPSSTLPPHDTKALEDDGPHPRDLSTHLIPASCFETCNNAYLEAQSIGKTARICRPQSAFMTYYLACDACVDRNADQTTGALGFITSSSYLSGKFAQFLRFCRVKGTGDSDVGEKKPPPAVGASSLPAAAGAKTLGASPSSSGPAAAVVSPEAGRASPHPGAAFAEQKGAAGASPTGSPTASPPSSLSSQTEAAKHGAGQSLELTSSSNIAPTAEDKTSEAGAETPVQQHSPQENPPGAVMSHAEADVSSTEANNAPLITGPAGTAVVTAGSSTLMRDSFGKYGVLLFAIIASFFIV